MPYFFCFVLLACRNFDHIRFGAPPHTFGCEFQFFETRLLILEGPHTWQQGNLRLTHLQQVQKSVQPERGSFQRRALESSEACRISFSMLQVNFTCKVENLSLQVEKLSLQSSSRLNLADNCHY